MSEELISMKLTSSGIKIWKYQYYPCRDTTLAQFRKYKIVPDKDYDKYSSRRPDGLIVDRQDEKNRQVIVVLEYKQPTDFRTDIQKIKATQQCNDICQEVSSNMGVITDGITYIWINPNQEDKQNEYKDETTGKKRSYSFISNEDKKFLTEPFNIQTVPETNLDNLDELTKNTLDYIERILSCVDKTNSTLKQNVEVDPLGLAKSVWQDIYINTGKEPEKCLYNVVELFIFKFLSDLNILKTPNDFNTIYDMYSSGVDNKEVLRYYAVNSRKKIRALFPAGADKTTIINGTIFVDGNGNPVESQANLFKNSIKKYHDFGTLKHVKKEFKTKLFETFLKQSSDKSKLGQFFTPRKVVRAVVDMANVENLPEGARVCDPFCGVGGFIAETIQKPIRRRDFIPTKSVINSKIVYHGFDKGSDSDEERLIILAKANLLIYLSDILEKYPTLTSEFAKIFNSIFHFLTDSNLGTLKIIISDESLKYDLILTNPPYITSGVKSIKEEIKTEKLEEQYPCDGKGVDSLALEWIVRSLKKGGKAFIIVPNGLLHVSQNKALRQMILKQCYINCIISLPIKTFFNTPQKTYIFGITKKQKETDVQDFSVFTYLVSDIGETLDVYRFETEGKSDLEKAKELFNSYKGSPKTFPIKEINDPRCKLADLTNFTPCENWDIDHWWTKDEKIKLGFMQEEKIVSIEELKDIVVETSSKLKEYESILEELKK